MHSALLRYLEMPMATAFSAPPRARPHKEDVFVGLMVGYLLGHRLS